MVGDEVFKIIENEIDLHFISMIHLQQSISNKKKRMWLKIVYYGKPEGPKLKHCKSILVTT